MKTIEVTILEPKAESMLKEMESNKLVKLLKQKDGGKKEPLKFGCMSGMIVYIADDFDAPLEDFEEYA